jgi:hypothetical protein
MICRKASIVGTCGCCLGRVSGWPLSCLFWTASRYVMNLVNLLSSLRPNRAGRSPFAPQWRRREDIARA